MTEQQFKAASPSTAHEQMLAMVTGHWISQIVRALADLSVADHLFGRSMTSNELALLEDSDPNAMFRLLRAGVAAGLLTADTQGRFNSTPLLETLRTGSPGSLRDLALTTTMPAQWLPWNEFTTTVRTGQTQVESALGMGLFDYLAQHPSQACLFSAGLRSATAHFIADAADAIDTTGVDLAVDVGGATGSLLHLLQEANPALRGIIFDQPHVVEDATAQTARRGLARRTTVIGGNFFESVPAADLYLLKFILHDWDDDDAVTILNRCRRAMREGARIAIIEVVLGDLSNPGFGAVMDMNMLSATDGRERSLDEYDTLLAGAALRRTSVRSTNSPQSVIEAVAADY